MKRFIAFALFALAIMATGTEAAERRLRVMPLGDSITEGWRRSTTYRYWLGQELAAAGVPVDFVGSLSGTREDEPPSPEFDADHEGHWGWRTGQVLDEIDEWARSAKPDVVLVHLGTNDVGRSPEAIGENLATIVDRLRAVNPRVVVLVARLIPIAHASVEAMAAVNESIGQMARSKNDPKAPVVLVPQDAGFDARRDTTDGVHPNEAGARKMAARWLEAIRPFLPSRLPTPGEVHP